MSIFDYPKEVVVFEWAQYDGGDLPKKAVDVIALLSGVLDAIPAEYREGAELTIDSHTSWDQSIATMRISYERPPTPDEIAARRSKSKSRAMDDLELARRRVADEERRLAELQKDTKP